MSTLDPKALKAKTLAKIKKLRETKMLARSEERESGESEVEEEGDFLTTAVEKMKSSQTGASKPKVVVMDDGDEELEDEEANGAGSAMEEENINEEIGENEKIVEEEIEQAPTETVYKMPKMVKRPYRLFTISIGFPDSVIQKCQSFELRNFMLSQLARIASIQMVDEIILVKDNSFQHRNKDFSSLSSLTKILQYLETPQYLRKAFFPISQDLKYVGLMNPIESSHHLKTEEYCKYREGVVLNRPVKDGAGSWVDIGLLKQLKLNVNLVPNTRVTVRINEDYLSREMRNAKHLTGVAVSPTEPKIQEGLHWGYSVRSIEYFSAIDKTCPYPDGYQLKILVDQKYGSPFDSDCKRKIVKRINKTKLSNILIYFSGVENIGSLLEADEHTKLSAEKAVNLFDFAIRLSGTFGVKKIHAEEEMMLILHQLRELFVE